MNYNIEGQIGIYCITLDDGQKVYDAIYPELHADQAVELNFQNVKIVASPFLNAAIGQLLREFTPEQLNKQLKFLNLSAPSRSILRQVVENAKAYYSDPEMKRRLIKSWERKQRPEMSISINANIVDLTKDAPKPSDKFWVDSNVWLWVSYPPASINASYGQATTYPNYINQALVNGSNLFKSTLSFAEVAHTIERREWEIYLQKITLNRKLLHEAFSTQFYARTSTDGYRN